MSAMFLFAETKTMKSIKTRILTSIILLAVIPSVTLGAVSALNTYQSTMEVAANTMSVLIKSTSDRVHYQLESYLNAAKTAGADSAFSGDEISTEEKRQ